MTTYFDEVKQLKSQRAGAFDSLAKRLADDENIAPETVLATIEDDGRSIEDLEAEVARRRKRAALRKAIEETIAPIPGQAEAVEALAQADAAEAQRRSEFAEKRIKLATAAAAFEPLENARVNARSGFENELRGLSRDKVRPELRAAHQDAQREVELADAKRRPLRDRLDMGKAAASRAREAVGRSFGTERDLSEKEASEADGFVTRSEAALADAEQELAAAVARQKEVWAAVQADEVAAANE